MNGNSLADKFTEMVDQSGYNIDGLTQGAKQVLINIIEDSLLKNNTLDKRPQLPADVLLNNVPVEVQLNPDSVVEKASCGKLASDLIGNCAASSGAAAISAITSGSMKALEYIDHVKNGNMSVKDATIKIVGETIASAADSALKAAGASVSQTLKSRYGSEQAAIQHLAQQGIQTVLEKVNIHGDARRVIDVIADVVNMGSGNMSQAEYAKKYGSRILALAGESVNKLGSMSGMGAAKALLAKGGANIKSLVPNLGKVAGILIAGTAMKMAIQNGLERPYQDLVKNTDTLKAAATELDRISHAMFNNQVLFTRYLESDLEMEAQLNDQMKNIDRAGKNALDAICKI